MNVNARKRKVLQVASSNFAPKWLLCKTMFWTIVALLSVAYVTFILNKVFFKENSHSYGKFTERLFPL